MQFKHPEILYALFLLLIPIIVHLFQLRRFKKVPFTNVQFLKEIELQTRKSSRLKKFLVMLSRMLLFAALIIAFAQPSISKENNSLPIHNYIYLDNSFSMQAKGQDGELLKRAAQDIIEHGAQQEVLHLFTNDKVYPNLTSRDIKNTLLSIDYHPTTSNISSTLLKIKNSINKSDAINNIILISDFQGIEHLSIDSLIPHHIIQLKGMRKDNMSLDSMFVSDQDNETITIKTILKRTGTALESSSISLYNDQILTGKSTAVFNETDKVEVAFSLPKKGKFNGRLVLDDTTLPYDNELFFTIDTPEKINVTAVGQETSYLSKIYTKDEFNFTSTSLANFNYNTLEQQQVLILNELENIPSSFLNALKTSIDTGLSLVIIPPLRANMANYNSALKELLNGQITAVSNEELPITTIHFSHPFIKGVFEKRVQNFQYPTVKTSYKSTIKNASSILSFENGQPFVSDIQTKKGSIYWFSSPISSENSNFKDSPLIVPVFYNIGIFSFKPSKSYYTIGQPNTIEVATQLNNDGVLHFENESENFIPIQRVSAQKVRLNTEDRPTTSGFVTIKKDSEILKTIAFNYGRTEGDLNAVDAEIIFSEGSNITFSNSIGSAFNTISDTYKTSSLWQLFVSIALLFLCIEILLLKFLKS